MDNGGAQTSLAGDSSRWGVLRHRHFRTIWLAAFGSYVGTWFEFVALRWIIAQETKSEAWLGYLAAAQLCPMLVLGMLGGVVADSVNRRALLIWTQAAMMVIALAMAGVVAAGAATPVVFLLLALLQGVVVAFNVPAWQVLTPRLVPKSDLTRAITLNGISFNMARVVGPAIGGVIMRAFRSPVAHGAGVASAAIAAAEVEGTSRGAAALLFFNAATFVVVMLAVLTTPDAPAPPEMRGMWKRPHEALMHAKNAVLWVWHNRGARALLLATVLFAVFATPIMQVMPLIVSEVYHRKEDSYGVLLAIMGFGAVTGGLAMKHFPKWYPMHHFIPLCVGVSGVLLFAFALVSDPVWGLLLMFGVGALWMWTWNSMAAAMQHLVPDAMRGRVSSVMSTIAMGLMPAGTFIAGFVGHAGERLLVASGSDSTHSGTSTQLGLAGVSLPLIVAGMVMLTWRTPEVDGIQPGQPGYDRVPGLLRGLTAQTHRPPRA
ncbi:MAG: MFS transporter [Phycisphaerales bacterium]